jgi:protein ImuA
MEIETPQRSVLLARLRDEIRRLERRPDRRSGVLACGLASVDEALAAGGFPRGVLSELRGGPASGKTAVALALVAAMGREELTAWVDGAGELYPPAVAALGVDLDRFLLVRPGAPDLGSSLRVAPGLWAAEALLSSGAFGAVVIDVPLPPGLRGADGLLRRLQTAAERGGSIGLWLSAPESAMRVPSGVRLDIVSLDGRVVARREGRPALRRAGGGIDAA